MADWIELFNGQNLQGWTARSPHEWRVAGAVQLGEEDPKLFRIEPGTGIMVNSDTGRTVDLHTTREHGSCELHVEYCVALKSNSGVYLMGQYEVQILDSWGQPDAEVTYTTNGGIYARWKDETKTPFDGAAP